MSTEIRRFIKEMSELREKKRNELDRRGKRANELLERSDEVFRSNKEQWEAYQQCIEHQHNKMMGLIHELFVIQNILDTTQADHEETHQ